MKQTLFFLLMLFLNIANPAIAKQDKPFSDLTIVTVSSDSYSELWDMHYHFLF